MNLKRIPASVLDIYLRITVLTIILLLYCGEVFAQEPPPRPVEVTVTQNISFGALTYGVVGGTVTVNSSGTRFVASGDIILLSLGVPISAGCYKLVGNPGTLITLVINPSGYTLTGSPSGSMIFHIADTSPTIPFIITTDLSSYTLLYIGGTLTVGNSSSNPAGNYSGSFDITFIQE